MTDPIADMLTRIRNAFMAGHDHVEIPGSVIKGEITRVLAEEGYVESYKTTEEGCLLYTSPSPRDRTRSRMPSSA